MAQRFVPTDAGSSEVEILKQVIFYTKKDNEEVEVGRVWNENGELQGTVNEIFLRDLKDWFLKSGETIDQYLENLRTRFDGTFLFAGAYKEASS